MDDLNQNFPGLTAAQAAECLARDGFNELPRGQSRTAFRIVLEVLREPMLALLVGGGAVYLLLGSREEALILLLLACLSVGITVFQEARTEKVLEALRDLTSPRALVIRDGARQRIAGREVVCGDLIVLDEGDRVPADAALLQATGLWADESLLTGEAVPVRKLAGDGDLARVFAGSLVVRGSGFATVTATGAQSEIGKIGSSLDQLDTEMPHLRRQMQRLVMIFAVVGGLVSLAVVVLYGTLRGGWLEATLAGIAVGMSMLPEEIPMVLAVFMAMGAWRISRVRVLTRRASAIETLGAATVLCTDKTGTLTENRMTITALRLPTGESCLPQEMVLEGRFKHLAERAMRASAPHPFDPMERAFHALVPEGAACQLCKSYPITPEVLAMTQVWQTPEGLFAAAKGAPEAVAHLCGMSGQALADLMADVADMASAGLRVLAVAEADCCADLPHSQSDFSFRLLGLVGLSDPLRAGVPDAVAQCHAAGIRVVMITGDFPVTAQAIARAAGLTGDQVITGAELAAMNDVDLARAMRDVTIFARIMPKQKLRLVQALKAGGEVVAMTGDGVNDAPSLKAAHIGVAMGGRGTDVAREAASIVLLDDDFGSIVTTIRLGRRIYDNLRKAMSFILAVHVPIAALALMPLMLGLPLLFGPVHIAFLEMVIDPVCSLVFEDEREERGVMRRPPRPVGEPLFSIPTILWSLLQGILVFGAVGAIFWYGPIYGLPPQEVRAMTFVALIAAIIALILVDRSLSLSLLAALLRPNRALAVVIPIVASVLAVAIYWRPAQQLFGFAALSGTQMAVPLAAAVAVLLLLQAVKPIWRWQSKQG